RYSLVTGVVAAVAVALVGLPFGLALADGEGTGADLFAILATLAVGALLILLVGALLLGAGVHF
ncbi:MAG: hypothetical protein ABEK12_00960, partial [Candidatus Nanohaloarchaea archaeon]